MTWNNRNESEGTWGGELTALEARAEIDSLEDLQSRRRSLVAQNAHLMARYGNFGMADDFRKRMVEALKVKARMELQQQGSKTTESMIDAAAYGSDEYAAFLDNALSEKMDFLRVQTAIDEINERIRGRELAIMAYNAELKLAR